MENLTVSVLPNIHFYSGSDASLAGQAIENREYGTQLTYFGELCLTRDYNSYWNGEGLATSIFGENPTKYSNIGDIVNASITYMDKFKANKVDIKVDKNILTFNYNFEDDLASDYENTHIIPSTVLLDLLQNMNDMKFNKRNYYKNNYELKEVSYLHKKYPYNPEGTQYSVQEGDEIVNYDFSRTFTDYKYSEVEHEISYEGHIMREVEQEDGSIAYIPTEQTYTGIRYEYTYLVSDINPLKDRVERFFENKSDEVSEARGNFKTYFISDLDSMITLSLNTYSLGSKNIYAYFNFNSKYNDWFNKSIAITTKQINNGDNIVKLTPYSEDYFGVNNGIDSLIGGDKKVSEELICTTDIENPIAEDTLISIINPSNIKKLDFTSLGGNIKTIDLINQYIKKLNVYDSGYSNWIIDSGCKLESLIVGSENITNNHLTSLKGINSITSLKELDITNCQLDKNIQINKLSNLNIFKAKGSNITSFVPKKGLSFNIVELPDSINTLTLKDITINNFDYTPTGELINLSLEHTQGINTQKLVQDWVHVLETTDSSTGDNKLLYDGIITNTNLTGINWNNYPVLELLKLKYLGLNKFEGTIGIKGSGNDNVITRKEYLQLRNVFGDKAIIQKTTPILFTYILDPNAFKQIVRFFYYDDIVVNGETISTRIEDTTMDYEFNMFDTTGGHSFLDYIEKTESIELTKNKENFGYEAILTKKIYTDNNDKSSLTKNLTAGDIVLYKGNKLILVYKTTTTVYNYTKIGRFLFTNTQSNKIEITK